MMADEEIEYDRGYCSIEEHMLDCMDFFLRLQKCREKQEPEENRAQIEGQDPERILELQEVREEVRDFRKLAADIAERERSTQIFLPALYLRENCGLAESEYWLVLFAFCCELESGLCLQFWKQYNNMWPTIQYALHLLSDVFPADFALIAKLCGQKHPIGDILEIPPENENNQGILQQPLLLNRSAFYFLLTGSPRQEQWCEFYLQKISGIGEGESYLDIHREEYTVLVRHLHKNSSLRILVNGRRGSGKHTLFKRLVSQGGRNGILLKMSYLYKADASEWEKMKKHLRLMDSLVKPVVILDFQGLEHRDRADKEERQIRLEEFLMEKSGTEPVFFLTDSMEGAETVRAYTDIWMDLSEFLSMEEKKVALDNFIKPVERMQWQDELLGRYRLSIGELNKRLNTISFWAEKHGYSLKERQPWVEGIRERAGQDGLGKIIESGYSLEDLVIPRDCRRQLEIVIKLSEIWFYKTAGWQEKQEGLQMLFHGASGTGKTMAASVLAEHLHLPLFKVDLSRIFDKYIGETEKHLDEIFQMAQRGSYILFFDEADALFSKRMGIHDSHDKYANVATSYLLQRMEAYDGILILATNLMDHFDDAFLRRIRFVIKFKNLEKEDRALLWERLLRGVDLAEDVSPKALAQAAELSPARIRVTVQTAKMLAASENSRQLTNEHLRIALELETGKDETTFYINEVESYEKELCNFDEGIEGGS